MHKPQMAEGKSHEQSTTSRHDYKYLTRELLEPEKAHVDLAQGVMNIVERVRREDIRNIVLLDKSARPLATLFRDLWDRAYPDEQPPKINFINIGIGDDNAYWQIKLDPDRALQNLTGRQLREIQKRYAYLRDAQAGTKALIVDEYSETGTSLRVAVAVLEILFPHMTFLQAAASFRFPAPWMEAMGYHGHTGVVDAVPRSLVSQSADRKEFLLRYSKRTKELATLQKENAKLLKNIMMNAVQAQVALNTVRDFIAQMPDARAVQHLQQLFDQARRCHETIEASHSAWGSGKTAAEQFQAHKTFYKAVVSYCDMIENIMKTIVAMPPRAWSPVTKEIDQLTALGEKLQKDKATLDWESLEEIKLRAVVNAGATLTEAKKNLREDMHALAEEYWTKLRNKDKS